MPGRTWEDFSSNAMLQAGGCSESIRVDGVNRHFKANFDVALCAEVVYFIGLELIDNGGKVAAIGKVAVNKTKIRFFVGVFI